MAVTQPQRRGVARPLYAPATADSNSERAARVAAWKAGDAVSELVLVTEPAE